jgi:hypothetical protein
VVAVARRTRPGPVRAATDPLTALAALEPVLVLDLDSFGGASLRAVRDAVEALPEVANARAWALGDPARRARMHAAAGSLNRRSYAASMAALERSIIPF